MTLQWQDNVCHVFGTRLRFITSNYGAQKTTDDEIILCKGPFHFGAYERLFAGQATKNVLEFGIFEGGSAVVFASMFPNAKIVGIDLRPPNPAVLAHIQRMGLADRVRLYYGVSQDDVGAVSRIIKDEFDAPLDLVIDDASHLYDFSRRTFELAFPALRRGGCYVLEDWDWAHGRGAYTDWSSPVLSNLVYELSSLIQSAPAVITEARIIRSLAAFYKGTEGGDVTLDKLIHTGGRQWPKL